MKNILFVSFFLLMFQIMGCMQFKNWLVTVMSNKVSPTAVASDVSPNFKDAPRGYPQKQIKLELFAEGFTQITDIQFSPDHRWMFVAEKTGALKVFDRKSKKTKTLTTLSVSTDSEMGLLGIALHPKFSENGKFYLNYTISKEGGNFTQITGWELTNRQWEKLAAKQTKVFIEVKQPYPNHDAGQLAFGTDGYLYVGFGDGGYANDPHNHGQNSKTLLGSMQRLNVDTGQYETWAIGLRNPWRYSFDRRGRIIVADVGQNKWEEVSIIDRKGLNLGWRVAEANHCFNPSKCELSKYHPAIIEYGRNLGQSITGGYEVLNKSHLLEGHYLYADFASGNMWAARLPEDAKSFLNPSQIQFLGKWPLQIATFGRDPSGNVYVANFSSGAIYLIR